MVVVCYICLPHIIYKHIILLVYVTLRPYPLPSQTKEKQIILLASD